MTSERRMGTGKGHRCSTIAALALIVLSQVAGRSHAFSPVSSRPSGRSALTMSTLSRPPTVPPNDFASDPDNDWMESGTHHHKIHTIATEQHHRDFLQKHDDKLVVIKYFSASCKACQALAPKYKAFVRNHNRLSHTSNVVFAEMSTNRNDNHQNMDFFERTLMLNALPSIQIYAGGGTLLDSFPCPPNMFPTFKRKVAIWMERSMHPKTADRMMAKESKARSSLHHTPDGPGEFFAGQNGNDGDIPLQLSDMFMDDVDDDDDVDHVPRNNIIPSYRSKNEFFINIDDVDALDIPLQPSDLFMMMDDLDDLHDVHDMDDLPRNNIIPSHRSSEFFVNSDDADASDIPLQPSDLFMMMDDLDDVDDMDDLPRNNIIPSHRSSEFFVSCDDADASDIPLQPSDLFMMDIDDDHQC